MRVLDLDIFGQTGHPSVHDSECNKSGGVHVLSIIIFSDEMTRIWGTNNLLSFSQTDSTT